MNALEQFCLKASQAYLQSAVFIDDNIFEKSSGMPSLEAIAPFPVRKPIFSKKSVSTAELLTAAPAIGESRISTFHPKDIVNSFAREGITCALYEPEDGFSTNEESEIFKLCERPDIIILDWDFSGYDGKKSLALISALVHQSSFRVPHHVRMLAVYTSDPSLVGIANSICDRLTANGEKVEAVGSQYRIQTGASRLLILGKPVARFGEEEAFTVREDELAKRLIHEFALMNQGIMPAVALRGLAAIRRNSKRILDRFGSGLDGAFLLHRAMISSSEEGFEQLPDLISDELQAIVEDDILSEIDLDEIAAAALSSDHLSADDKKIVNRMVKDRAKLNRIVSELTPNNNAPECHRRFAALFSSRIFYSKNVRHLTFGTIIRHREKKRGPWNYAVCLIPSCDSLRLDADYYIKFPFWELSSDIYGGKAGRKGFVVEGFNSELISLSVEGSVGDMFWTEWFLVDSVTKSVSAHRFRNRYLYEGPVQQIEWVGQLKPLHAHRIAKHITEQLERIGLSEADWLRELCRMAGT